MKEVPEKHPEFDPETYTNPILEECYRIKAEISATIQDPRGILCVFESRRGRRTNGTDSNIFRMIRPNTHPRKNLKTMTNHERELQFPLFL